MKILNENKKVCYRPFESLIKIYEIHCINDFI